VNIFLVAAGVQRKQCIIFLHLVIFDLVKPPFSLRNFGLPELISQLSVSLVKATVDIYIFLKWKLLAFSYNMTVWQISRIFYMYQSHATYGIILVLILGWDSFSVVAWQHVDQICYNKVCAML
jgi:hypothetical protein